MDELYFEEGYVEASYFGYIANATAGFTPYIAEGYLPTDFFEERGAFAAIFCDAEIVVGMLLEAQGNLYGEFTFAAAASKVTETSIALNSSFTQTAVGTRGKDIDLFAFSDAAIAVSVDRIRDNNIATSVAFDVATDFVVERSADSDVDAVFTAIINGLRSRDNSIETQAAFSFDVTADLFKDFESDISAEASASTTVEIFRDVESSPSAEFAQSASGDRIRFGVSDLTSTVDVDVTARKIRDAHLTGTGVAAIECNAVKTTETTSTFESQASIGFLGGLRTLASAALPVYASVFVSRKIADLRPRNLPIVTNSGTYYDATNKKFGTHSLHSSDALNFDRKLNPGVGGLPNNIPISNGQSFVLECWVRLSSSISSQAFIRVAGVHLNILTNSQRFQGGVLDQNGNYAVLSGVIASAFSSPTVFNHLLAVSDGTRISFYVNGTRQFTSTSLPSAYWNGGVYMFGQVEYWVDELSFYTGTTLGFNPSSTSITVPTSTRTDSAYAQGLWHFDNNGLDDYTPIAITHSGASAITSSTSLTSSIGGVFNITANISSQATVTAVVGTLEDINLVAFSDAAVNAVGVAVRDSNVTALVEASVSADGVATRDGVSSQSGDFATETSANRIRFGNINTTGNFAQSADAVKTADISSALSAVSSVAAVIGTLEDINLVAFSDAAVITQAVKTASGAGAVTAAFTQESAAVKTTDTSASINGEFSQSADNSRTRDVNASFSALASTVTLANEIEGIVANLSSRFFTTHFYIEEGYNETGYYQEFETSVSRTASGVALLEFTASLTAGIRTDVFVAMTTTSSASVTADVVKTTDVVVLEVSESTLSAVVNKTTAGVSTVSASFTIFCNGVTASEINLVAFSNASLSATAEANKPFSSSLSSQATFYAYTQDSLNSVGSANISSEFTTAITANYIVDNLIQTDAIASSLTVAVKDVAVDTVCEINAILFADAQRTRSVAISTTSTSVLTATAVKITDTDADFENQANIEANVVKVVSASITTEAVASNLTAVVRLAGLFIECLTSASISATGVVTRSAATSLTANVSTVANVTILFIVNAAITTSASVSAIIGLRKDAASSITSAMSFVVEIRELRLEEILYVIPGENWTYVINSESRYHSIYGETRVRAITGESREKTIVGESRIHILD